MKYQLLLLCTFCVHTCYGQVVHPSTNSGHNFPGSWSLHFTDVFSFTDNPSALANIKVICAGISSERRFMLKELDRYDGAIAIPFNPGVIGASVTKSGTGD